MRYFNRDISWLSFNERVLMEATDTTQPLYERLRFLSIHSSNLEEFYRVRLSEHRHILTLPDATPQQKKEAKNTISEISLYAAQLVKQFHHIFTTQLLPALAAEQIILYQSENILPAHLPYINTYFHEEVFPYIQPVLLRKGEIVSFLRDSRLYLFIAMRSKHNTTESGEKTYAVIKIPYAKVPRFVTLPQLNGKHYIIFIEKIIALNLDKIFPGYEIMDNYSIRISRDADFEIENPADGDMIKQIREHVSKRKIGATNRLVYDATMPAEMLNYLCENFEIPLSSTLAAGRYLTLEDLSKLPNPTHKILHNLPTIPIRLQEIDSTKSIFKSIIKQDMLLYYPYHTFDHFLRFLNEAAYDPKVSEIKITQYRVAENSAVINSLITAARNGTKVTVFVELKARFDEENNIVTSQKMQEAGIKIVYSQPHLKVHAKIALVLRKNKIDETSQGFAYLSTGNFNEKTAQVYADFGLFTQDETLVQELKELFRMLEGKQDELQFSQLLVSPYNMSVKLCEKISFEIAESKAGRESAITLKMNALQDKEIIDLLYSASKAGVKINLIVRGICCLIPNQSYSKNIRIVRLVDNFLEHARVWYFYAAGAKELYLTSADLMHRNLSRRVECAFPIKTEEIKEKILTIINLQLQDNVKACNINENLQNIYNHSGDKPIRAQVATYTLLAKEEENKKTTTSLPNG